MLKNKAMMISGLGLGLLGLGGVASADEVSTQNYTVVAGDTVSNIATKFNSTVSEIDSLNNFKDVNMIFVGEIIKVPSNTLKTNNTTYQTTKPVSVVTPVQQSQTQINTNQSNNHDMGYSVKPQATEYPQQTKPVQNSGGGSVNAYRERRKQIESNGNYSTNTGNGYWGAYQFAPATVRGIEAQTGMKWDWSPKTQDAFADYYAQSKYGGWHNVPTTGGW